MFIEKIEIKNFRVYKGQNELNLSTRARNNVSIISGNNGFGKTSFLTSLVWCLYGKLMADVDDRYRQEIQESGGYTRYCGKLMNKAAITDNEREVYQYELALDEANAREKTSIKEKITNLSSFSVAILFRKILIPSMPCEYVRVKRTYNVITHKETVEILVDGRVNELTADVGPDIFINDFILPKEIAKFFFFDAEKIVSLAEIRTSDDKKILSQAYSEVLGIKKYIDLKDNLENLRLRLRKKTSNENDRQRLEKLEKQKEQNEKLAVHYEQMIKEKEEELIIKRRTSNELQEKLIREGTSVSIEELREYKKSKEYWNVEGLKIKERLKDIIELAPFAIAGNKFSEVRQQLEKEQEQYDKGESQVMLQRKFSAIKKALDKHHKELAFDKRKEEQLLQIIKETLLPLQKSELKPLLDFSEEQFKQFLSTYYKLQDSYGSTFKQLNTDLKRQQAFMNDFARKLETAESKEKDPIIKQVRNDKIHLDNEIKTLENEVIDFRVKRDTLKNEITSISGQVSTLSRKVNVEEIDKAKDETALRLITELEDFIYRLKVRKKSSLEKNILVQLNRLMHKSNFVNKVDVVIDGDLIDIELYDKKDQIINKDGLSKGEQQLYATALLKALIEESNVRFPVFIDSPLQKFDKDHAKNIVKDFYPNVAGQVVLFPLLEKELNEEEYEWILPRVGSAYLIEHTGQYQSEFKEVTPEKLFATYRKKQNNVYQH
ncbi:MAG: AAA family ATPase [Bacteroidia bacterium]